MAKQLTLSDISTLLDKKFKEEVLPITKTLKEHGKMLSILKKNQDVMLDMLDGEQMKQRKEIHAIKKHIGLSSTNY